MKEATNRSRFTPEGWHTVTPRIVVRDAEGLVEFLRRVFGATGDYRRDLPSVVKIGDSIIMVSSAEIRNSMPPFLYVTPGKSPPTWEIAMPPDLSLDHDAPPAALARRPLGAC